MTEKKKALTLNINPEEFNLGDMEDFANITGVEMDEAIKFVVVDGERRAKVPASVLIAFVYLTQRAVDPEFTLQDARNVKVKELSFDREAEDPTEAADATNG